MNISINPCSLAFRASVPETIGLKKANECAEKMLKSGSPEEQTFALDYKENLEKIRDFKDIEEVVVVKNHNDIFPYTIWIDGKHLNSIAMAAPFNYTAINPEDKETYGLMREMIIVGNSIDKLAPIKKSQN